MIEDTHVTLAHGNGGRRTRELIEEIFAHHLANPSLDIRLDAAPLDFAPGMVPYITTDSLHRAGRWNFPAAISARLPSTAQSTISRSAVPSRAF